MRENRTAPLARPHDDRLQSDHGHACQWMILTGLRHRGYRCDCHQYSEAMKGKSR